VAAQYGLAERPAPFRWTDATIKEALDEFLRGRTEWPRAVEFRAAGLGSLRKRMLKDGTLESWMRRYRLPSQGPQQSWR